MFKRCVTALAKAACEERLLLCSVLLLLAVRAEEGYIVQAAGSG